MPPDTRAAHPRRKAPGKVGHPTLLDDEERINRLLDLLRQGVPQEAASRSLGIARTTYHAWVKRGQDAWQAASQLHENPTLTDLGPLDRKYAAFSDRVEDARAEAEVAYALLVRRAAGKGDATSARWWLDRAHPERWAQRESIALTGADGGEVVIRLEFPGEKDGL